MIRILLFVVLLIPTSLLADTLSVFVSLVPQKTFVEKIGGRHVQVHAMVKPGHSPATYEPGPRQIAMLSQADVYLRAGVPFEHAWLARIQAANPAMPILDPGAGIDLRPLEGHAHHSHTEETHEHASDHDPHLWTSPPLVKQIASNIRDALIELDAVHTEDYQANYASFAAELDVLDKKIRQILSGVSKRKFMVFHPSWGYFADTYGLTQVPIEKAGKEPGARSLTRLIEQARREQIKVIFVQPQFDQKLAAQVARAIDGKVVTINALAENYAENLIQVAQLIAEGN